MASLKAFFGVARLPFLVLPVTLVAAGAAAAAWDGVFLWSRTLVALFGLIALHAAVNIINEVSDFKTGIDLHTRPTPFSGGSGTLPAGAMSSRLAQIFGIGCAALGLAAGIWFLIRVGWVLAPILVLGAGIVLLYTHFLARIGLGELAAGLGLGALPVIGTAIVQDASLGRAAVAAAVPAFCMTFDLLLLNEFPDEEADRGGGRRNLVLILGRPAAAWIYVGVGLVVPGSLLAAVLLKWLPALVLVACLPSLLLIKPVRWALAGAHDDVPVPALGANVIWNLTTNSLLAAALAVARFLASAGSS